MQVVLEFANMPLFSLKSLFFDFNTRILYLIWEKKNSKRYRKIKTVKNLFVQNDYFCQLAYSQALVVCKKTKQNCNLLSFDSFKWIIKCFFQKFINILALCEFLSRLRFWFKELCNELLLLGTNFHFANLLPMHT